MFLIKLDRAELKFKLYELTLKNMKLEWTLFNQEGYNSTSEAKEHVARLGGTLYLEVES